MTYCGHMAVRYRDEYERALRALTEVMVKGRRLKELRDKAQAEAKERGLSHSFESFADLMVFKHEGTAIDTWAREVAAECIVAEAEDKADVQMSMENEDSDAANEGK